LRTQSTIYVVLAVLWVGLAVVRWLDDDSPRWMAWVWTGLAVAYVAVATLWWRKRRAAAEGPAPAGVELLDVDETVLSRLVGAAVSDAEPDEVTPPMAGPRWGPERIEWLRRLHRDRRMGLDGPLGEATWAVAVDGDVVGGVRLKRTAEPDVLETGIWLTRSARGKGVARKAIADVLELARAHGARAVRADTSPENASALYVLQRLGFRTSIEADRVLAVRDL
jgi:RimJ/RimL family protein N-acetyltransferase